ESTRFTPQARFLNFPTSEGGRSDIGERLRRAVAVLLRRGLPEHHLAEGAKDLVTARQPVLPPPSHPLIGMLLVVALAASGAIYLILEMSQPFSGLMQISSAPLRNAVAPLGQ